MQRSPAIWPARLPALGMAALYALIMAYSSTVVGPQGLHFVPRPPREALETFLQIRFVANGSDQRADWIGNLLMLVPYGFLLSAALHPRRTGGAAAYAGALLAGIATVLAIKYAQLFFPPRTVTLNYVTAQSIGVVLGCSAFAVWRRASPAAGRWREGSALVLALRVYVLLLVLFLLMPLDFALNGTDLKLLIEQMPDAVTAIPGAGRPPLLQALLVPVTILAFVPVGVWLTLVQQQGVWRIGRPVASALVRGLALMAGVFVLSLLLISGHPTLVGVAYRMTGIALGIALMRWLVWQDPKRLRHRLRVMVPLLALPYLAALLEANGLLSTRWLAPEDIAGHVYLRGLIPLFNYYIVSKAEAAKNIAGHLAMYMPVGAALWLRAPWRRHGADAFLAGFLLAAAIEAARYARPDLEGDINTILVGGLGAWLAATLLPPLWTMLETLVRNSAARTTLEEIEHF